MNDDQGKAKTIFLRAAEIAGADECQAYLAAACGGDDALRGEVEDLLRHQERLGSFLEPAPGDQATVDGPRPSESPGTVIGPYKLLQQIGEGGMGTVFMAEQTKPVQRKVALKVIKSGMDSMQVIARFEAERQALSMMDHANIARVLDAGATESGLPYFVMELVHGVPITKYCDDNHLTPRERLELFVPVCQAIQHAHQKGIIHRDVKPSNVMITLYDGKPVPKVIDFGIAKATEQKLTERTLFTHYGMMVGTLEYMSPEQAEMSALGVDTRSDVYSLGVLLYELLTGNTPLSHKTMKEAAYAEIIRMIKEEEPPKPSTRLSDSGEALVAIAAQRHVDPARLTKLVRGELDWIVMKALEKDRNRRYESVSAFAADAQRYLNDEPVQACPPSAWYRFHKFARRNRAAVLTVAAAAGALVAVLAAGLFADRAQVAESRRIAESREHGQRLQAVKRRNALERALVAARCGDFDAADQAIDEAELLGTSPGQVRMLRGQVDLDRDNGTAAVGHLEQAVKLEPTSVAARALLTQAYFAAGQWDQYVKSLQILKPLSPVTSDDFLFMGRAEAQDDPTRAVRNLKEAVRRLPGSGIARLARAEAQNHVAQLTGTEGDAELAIQYANTAKDMLPGNSVALATSALAHLGAVSTFADQGRQDRAHAELEHARLDVETLGESATQPYALLARLHYFDLLGEGHEAALLKECRRVAEQTDHSTVTNLCAATLYRLGRFEEAHEVLDKRLPQHGARLKYQCVRAFVLAELPDGQAGALTAYEAAIRTAPDSFASLWASSVLRLLGRERQAVEACRRIRDRMKGPTPWRSEWNKKLVDYLCGDLDANDLLLAATSSRWDQCEGHYYIAMTKLAEGDRVAARKHFSLSVRTGVYPFFEHRWSRAFLARMDKDSTWPPWIPLKE